RGLPRPGLAARQHQVRPGDRDPRARRPRADEPAGDDEADRPPRARRARRAHTERGGSPPGRHPADRGGAAAASPGPLAAHGLAGPAVGRARRPRARRDRVGDRAARTPAARGRRSMKNTFSSLRYRNYRLFFTGQLVSQTGSWMQRIALGWFVLELTHNDAFAVGIMAFAQFLPFTLFGLFAGVITDRLDARRLVISTQIAQTLIAAGLTWIALGGFARPWMLYLIAFVNGTVLVLDVPSRQQLTYRMVGREALPNAIALNSSLFNASRIFGPSVAGILLGFAGVGACFLVNAIS